jgi:glycosyltransferase involved in cell wall biosynthesis
VQSVHVAVVSQNADLRSDYRPRAEAEALAAAGFRTTLVGPTKDPAGVRAGLASDVRLLTFPMPRPAGSAAGQVLEQGSALLLTARSLIRLSRTSPIDVLHCANPPDDLWPTLRLLKATQGRRPLFVYDQHDVAPVLLLEKYGSGPAMRRLHSVARYLERASFSRADLVVFASPEYQHRARSEGLLSSECEIVPNGWSLPEVAGDRSWTVPGVPLVAYVGAIGEQDCVDHLVEAVAAVDGREGIRVVVAGDGPARLDAQRRAEELGVGRFFDWLGWVDDRETIASLVRSADVCVAPEKESEFNRLASFVKLGEYMSAGAAIAAHRLPQTERLCGESVAYADDMTPAGLAWAIRGLLDDRERAGRIGETARARFETDVKWETVGSRRLVHAYERLVDARARSAAAGT